MPKAIKGNAGRKPPEPSAGHSDIDEWTTRQMPHLQPIVKGLDELIRATIPGLQYAVKWKRPYYGLPELGWIIEAGCLRRFRECRLSRRRRLQIPTPARNDRPDPLRQGDQPGRDTQRPELPSGSSKRDARQVGT